MTRTAQNSYCCSVAAVIAARNEAMTLREVVEGAARYVDKVYVLDGRSSDDTVKIAQEAGAEVHTDPGLGKGAAIRSSFVICKEDVLVFLHADGSHDPADIPRLATPVCNDELDLCVGSRFMGGSDELSVTTGQLIRTIGNISMNIAINKRWGVELSNTLNGFRAVRRAAVLSAGLVENRHTIEQEMVMKMLRCGYRVGNVAAHEYARKYGESHINIWKEWPIFVWNVAFNLMRRSTPRARAGE
jgi:dolichol-phosphate mannosyltransferase